MRMRKEIKMSEKVMEWRLQAAAVKRLKHHPEYGKSFLLAGDMNAGRRTVGQAGIAKATGMISGEPDLRIYILGGKLGMIEYKRTKNYLSSEQRRRHSELRGLGFDYIEVITADTEIEAADATVDLVCSWLPVYKRKNCK